MPAVPTHHDNATLTQPPCPARSFATSVTMTSYCMKTSTAEDAPRV
ncbi:hypothetical protein SAMN05444714_1206 [Yoonia litorea]|uniref:Uncharacterized protein n=1 Tax=Yoonia litorea TaxID=1123755 RepID=A0A1I6M410_9RHOB|nr:hypothetical protein SAMN05444714_1206 [Yoonia litorea]